MVSRVRESFTALDGMSQWEAETLTDRWTDFEKSTVSSTWRDPGSLVEYARASTTSTTTTNQEGYVTTSDFSGYQFTRNEDGTITGMLVQSRMNEDGTTTTTITHMTNPGGEVGDTQTTYTYDAAGNLVSDETTSSDPGEWSPYPESGGSNLGSADEGSGHGAGGPTAADPSSEAEEESAGGMSAALADAFRRAGADSSGDSPGHTPHADGSPHITTIDPATGNMLYDPGCPPAAGTGDSGGSDDGDGGETDDSGDSDDSDSDQPDDSGDSADGDSGETDDEGYYTEDQAGAGRQSLPFLDAQGEVRLPGNKPGPCPAPAGPAPEKASAASTRPWRSAPAPRSRKPAARGPAPARRISATSRSPAQPLPAPAPRAWAAFPWGCLAVSTRSPRGAFGCSGSSGGDCPNDPFTRTPRPFVGAAHGASLRAE